MDGLGYSIGYAIGYGAIACVNYIRENPGMAGLVLAALVGLLTARFARFRGA